MKTMEQCDVVVNLVEVLDYDVPTLYIRKKYNTYIKNSRTIQTHTLIYYLSLKTQDKNHFYID